MRRLIKGVGEFQSQIFDAQRSLFERLAEGQHPEALFITCSDSRIDPNLLTQTVPGDLFVIRNAGNMVPPASAPVGGEVATIEYALTALKVRDIVICGHSRCGAVSGLLSPDGLTNLPHVAEWLKNADSVLPLVRKQYGNRPAEEQLARAVEQNVLAQLDNLRTHAFVQAAIARNGLKLHGWVYTFETGSVVAYDEVEGNFLPLTQR